MRLKIEEAWQAFKDGHLAKAEYLSWSLLKQGAAAAQLPLAQSLGCRAYSLAVTGRQKEAVSILHNALNVYPKDYYAQELMLAILREVVSQKKSPRSINTGITPAHQGRLILGLGTGRCGSTTLANLLETQKNCHFSHECPPVLCWNQDLSTLDYHLRRFQLLLELFSAVGDAAHWWLPYFRLIRQKFPDMRAVALRRDKGDTVNSFLRLKGGGGKGSINHWVVHDGSYWRKNTWDDYYPKFQADTLKDAIACYWDEYYGLAEAFESEFPDQFRIFDISNLSSVTGQQEILAFCGITDFHLPGNLHANKGHVNDGASLWPNFLEVLA